MRTRYDPIEKQIERAERAINNGPTDSKEWLTKL